MAKSKNENINISIFTALKVSEVSKVPVLIMSNPGLGKSTTVSMFAKVRGYHLQLLRGNSTSETEVLGYDVVDQETGGKSTVHTRPTWYKSILDYEKKGIHTLLFLDEITTATEYVQSALLHLIFERMVGDEQLPEGTLIVSAGNYAQNLSNQMNMLPPLMNRFMIYNITPDASDLDAFLCKYEGAIADPDGNTKDYMNTLIDKMKKLDSQELDIPVGQYNKIGEFIERGIRETTKFLTSSSDKAIDFGVKDLQGLYADADDDSKLCGFVTFRTLNYLREITLAMFKCFGKAGITSDNYRNMIDGLCGFGISRDPKTKDVKKNYIGKDYYDSMVNIINDIEKMKNSKLPEYEKFFKTVTDNKKKFEVSDIQAIINKISELRSDKDLSNIERPIDPAMIETLCKILKDSGKEVSKIKVSSNEKMTDKITSESFIGYVTYWNTVAELATDLQSLISDSKMNYKGNTVMIVKDTQEDLRNGGFKLRSLRKILLIEDPALGNIIPEIKGFK